MAYLKLVKGAGIALFLIIAGCATPGQSASSKAPVEWDGLQRVEVKGLDLVYVRPGVSLAGYNKIMVDPLQITFSKNRDANGGYQIVTMPGPDVLHVAAAITDLNIAAPDTMSAGRSYTITSSKGSMTLVAELRDSETGELLARAVDRATGDSSFRYELANSVTNAEAARTAATAWARILRQRLDAARAASVSQ